MQGQGQQLQSQVADFFILFTSVLTSLDTENKFLNPIFGCRVKISPDINTIFGLIDIIV